MPKFRKKPVVIEAEQFNNNGPLPPGSCGCDVNGWYHVHTLEGISYTLTDGDWVIRGVKGEYYPCKPDIFESTYEVVNE